MRRFLALLTVVFLISGCNHSQEEMNSAIALRQRLLNSKGCHFQCEVTADYEDVLYTFTLDCNTDDQGNLDFCVVQPQSIAGITGNISAHGGKLTFDDKAIGFPLLSEGLLSPLSAPWLLIQGLRNGYISACTQSGSGLYLSISDSYEDDAVQMDLWTDSESNPHKCEFIWKGRRILSISILSFSYM